MVFIAEDLGAWLVFILAEAGRKKLTALALGNDQERALRSAATAAVQRTASELRPGDVGQAEHVALVISQVFSKSATSAPLAGQATMLEALQTGIAGQLAVLDDASLTGTGQSSADVLGVPGTVMAQKLTVHLLREIVARASRGGPLEPLANQLNHDRNYLQGLQVKNKVDRLDDKLVEVLARLDTIHALTAAPVALEQLPAASAGFTGRDDELAMLANLLGPASTPGAVLVSAVAGLAGVGKTTLAVQAGHRAVQRGQFRGGVLFIDLHGYDEALVEPSQALGALLLALGVPAEQIPATVQGRAAVYRSELARIGEPVLVIADNASTEAQVRPLLPGSGPHKVLVTSRHTLAGLEARLVDVNVLDEEASARMLDAALRIVRPGDDRISADPEAAAKLAAACGGLPLALQITAALLKADLTLAAGDLAEQLAAESARLEQLAYDDGNGLTATSVAAAFDLSYRRLDKNCARVFRLLPVSPGPDVSADSAAVLAGLPMPEVRRMLAALARAHLAEPTLGSSVRWRMHDLVRLYAQQLSEEHADSDGREQAIDRLLDYYAKMAGAADGLLRALPVNKVPAEFAGQPEALAWLDAERPSLVAAVRLAADTGRDLDAVRLPALLAEYFYWRHWFDDWIACAKISVNSARRVGDRRHEGTSLTALGLALVQARRFVEAITAQQTAAAIFQETGDRHDSGLALNNLGLALRRVGRVEEAITAHQAAAAIYRETGDRHDGASALNNLGMALSEVGRMEEAITACQQAAAMFQETGDRHGKGSALNNLGIALSEVGRMEEAITACQQAAAMFQETGDRHHEGSAMTSLGLALRQVGRAEEAITACREAAAMFRDTGDRHGEGLALGSLGLALRQVGRAEEAITACRQAAAIFRETGDQQHEEMALRDLERARADQ